MPILDIRNLTRKFGGLTALNEVSFTVEANHIHGLIGPNGAGKSTLFKNISGFCVPTSGDILFDGVSVKGRHPSDISKLGIVRTFQEATLFQELSVFDNVLVGTHNSMKINVFSSILGLDRSERDKAARSAMQMLDFMGLAERKHQLASELPFGSRRALGIAVALVSKPRLLLMDEPFAGMNPEETGRMMELTRKVHESGVTIVLVEHDMKAVMGLCDQLTVLNFGSLLAQGTPEQVRCNPAVISAYLGNGSTG